MWYTCLLRILLNIICYFWIIHLLFWNIPPPLFCIICITLIIHSSCTTISLKSDNFDDILLIFFYILFSESTADKRARRLCNSQRRAGTTFVFRIVVRRTFRHGYRDGQREYYYFVFLSLSVRLNVYVGLWVCSIP